MRSMVNCTRLHRPALGLLLVVVAVLPCPALLAADAKPATTIKVEPILNKFCFDCHGAGADEGGIQLDQLLKNANPATAHTSWLAVWKNMRAQTMPPASEAQPTDAERTAIIAWIESEVFRLNPKQPDPGRVTIRRLNRTEYAHTVRDLLGVDYDTNDAFPADDTGYGFDTIGEVLSLSPLLMEKYLEAAQEVIAKAIPSGGARIPTRLISPDQFRNEKNPKRNAKQLPFAEALTVQSSQQIQHPGRYRLKLDVRVNGADEATSNTAKLLILRDGEQLVSREFGWDVSKSVELTTEVDLTAGKHLLAFELVPGAPPAAGEDKLNLSVQRVELHGPLDGSFKEYPPNYRRVFLEGPPPAEPAAREQYTRHILRTFADRAFRRPIDQPTLDRLVKLTEDFDPRPSAIYEDRITYALTAVLASPRFLFRAETQPEPNNPGRVVPLDEFAVAARLSYFLWSSAPDEALFQAAQKKELRTTLRTQIDRLLDDPKGQRFVENFVGQWLQTRDVETINVDARRILNLKSNEEASKAFTRNIRRAMSDETEQLFAYLLAENRSALELLTADYTFVNEPLAKFYGIEGVKGDKQQKTQLPADSHRGGILTQGSFLIVTSNPARTSPVKRGLFILENLLGTPAPPPPPDVPELETVKKGAGKNATMRDLMELHRRAPLCASCHARMDPLGLALEEFNALGMWRNEENGKPIETKGQLITGEKFNNVQELSQVIATARRKDFYRCLTEKVFTYAIGRGVEYYDAPTIDQIVDDLEKDGGKMRTLIYGIVESPAFQSRRGDGFRTATTGK